MSSHTFFFINPHIFCHSLSVKLWLKENFVTSDLILMLKEASFI